MGTPFADNDVSVGNSNLPERSIPSRETVGSKTKTEDMPFSLYRMDNKIPFSVKFFGLQDFGQLSDLTDVNGLREKAKAVDAYVSSLITEQGLEDKVSSFGVIVNKILEKMGCSIENMDTRFNKIIKFIEVMNKVKVMDKEKQQLLESVRKKDIIE